jgi:hypothetical protein
MAGTHIQHGLVLRGQSLGPIIRSIESRPSGKLARRSWPDEQVSVWERALKLEIIKS